MNDQELLQRFIHSGDQAAFSELVSRYVNLVHGIARRQAPAHADDVTQAAFWILSQHPRRALANPVLAGWLFRVTWNCCANARKSDKRRSLHEREAGRIMVSQDDSQQREETTRQLDVALAALPERYRDAVLLRYLQGRSIEETAASLGLSPAAAGKRATRGLEKLRARFARKGIALGAAGMTGVLTAEAALGAPAAVVHAIADGASTSGGISVAAPVKMAMLAHGAAKPLAATLPKLAVAMAALLSILAILPALRQSTTSAAPPDSLVPAMQVTANTLESPVDETRLPGNLCFAHLQMLLDADGAAALSKVTDAIQSESTFYQLRQGNAAALHAALKTMQADGHILDLNRPFQFTVHPDQKYDFLTIGDGRGGISAQKGHGLNWSTSFNKQGAIDTGALATSDGQKVSFDFKVDSASAFLQNAPLRRDGTAQGRLPAGTPNVQQFQKEGTIKWTGALEPGRMLLMVGDFGEFAGDHIVIVRVVEIYKATDLETRYMNYLDAALWLDGGPAALRALADRGLVWAATDTAAPPPVGKDTWTKRLSDGTTISLTAIAQPRDLPLLSWSPDGQPLLLPFNRPSVARRGPGPQETPALTATVQVLDPSRADNGPNFQDSRAILPDDLSSLHLFVGVGDWTIQPIQLNQSVRVGTNAINFSRMLPLPAANPTSINVFADGDLTADTEVHLGAITKDGKSVIAHNFPGVWGAVWFPGSTEAGGGLGVTPDQVDHFAIFSRKRQEVVFEGFKSSPPFDLPARVTLPEVRAAEAKLLQADWDAHWREISAELARADAVPRDPATPAGAIRLMTDRALAGDVKGLRDYIAGEDPRATAYAQDIVARMQAFQALVKKFGLESVYRAHFSNTIWNGAPTMWQLVAADWSHTQDRQQNRWIVMVLRNGKWNFELSPPFPAEDLGKAASDAATFIKDLSANKFKNVDDAMDHYGIYMFPVPIMLQ